jgi:hypothetical protein
MDPSIADAPDYWVTTVSASGRPHAVPVQGVWLDEVFYFGGGPDVLWARNLRENPFVSIIVGGGADATIFEGPIERTPEGTDVPQATNAYKKKYGFPHPPPFWVLRDFEKIGSAS